MRLSLALRIVLVHLVFTLGAATVAVLMVRDSFERYRDRWESEVATLPPDTLFRPLAHEIARSLLLSLDSPYPEVREASQKSISEGLRAILKKLPSIESLMVLDTEGRIQFASDSSTVGQGFTGDLKRRYLSSDAVERNPIAIGRDRAITEVVIPVFDDPRAARTPNATAGWARLGSLVVRYRPDPALIERIPALKPPSIEYRDFTFPVTLFLVAVGLGAVVVAGLTVLPVRRLDRALTDFRARDFRGGLDVETHGLQGELAGTVAAINELSGRFQALDARWREREALLGTLSRSLEEGLVAADPQGRPVTWNAAALRILTPEALKEEMDGRRRNFSEEDELAQALRHNPELLLRDPGQGSGGTQEMELLRDDDTRMPAQVTRVPFEVRPGETGTLLLIRDLATLRKVETHLLEAGRYAVLAHLAAGLAHEIRNPLHSIGLNAGVVQEYVKLDPTSSRFQAMSESLSTIQEETRRLTDLLNNYLGLVRPASEAEPVDVRDLCRRVVKLLEYTSRRARVDIVLEGEEQVPDVHGVGDRLQQAILNLVLNAVQAMPEGGTVHVRTSYDAGLVRITVSDTGPGLPREVEEHLFDVRVTTKAGGTGLGLPLVRMIAEAHGGSIWYRSTPGEGAAFTLVLPARMAASA